jgi:uncharacterized phage protein (TIGR02220 family)
MSVSTMAWAWKQKCTPTEKLILLALADHANDDGRCWPGMERVAQKTGFTRRAVVKSVKSLQAKGILRVTNRAVGGLKKSNVYTLIVDDENASPRCERGSHRCEPDDQIDVNEVHIEPIKEPSIKNNIPFSEIINFLNEKTGKAFKPTTSKTKSLITARWKEGFSLADFKAVISTMAGQWMGDEKMEPYLRPETLFGNKFEGYLQQGRNQQKVVQLTPKQRKDEEEWTAILSPT